MIMKKGLKAIVNLQKYENKLVKGIDIPPPNPCDQVDSTLPSLENETFENVDLRDCKFPKMSNMWVPTGIIFSRQTHHDFKKKNRVCPAVPPIFWGYFFEVTNFRVF